MKNITLTIDAATVKAIEDALALMLMSKRQEAFEIRKTIADWPEDWNATKSMRELEERSRQEETRFQTALKDFYVAKLARSA